MRNLRRSARRHQAVNSDIYAEFPLGLPVLTPEGLWGKVVAVEDGPHAGFEQYLVDLDDDMGGGEYDSAELMIRCDDCGETYNPDRDLGSGHEHRNAQVEAYHAAALGESAALEATAALTKTADEKTYLRVGTWRDSEESWNYATGDFEPGVSVYELDTQGQPVVPPEGEWAESDLRDRLNSDDPKFIVTGREIGLGGDGEPLLKDVRIVGSWPEDFRRGASLSKTADEDQCPYDASDSVLEDGLYTCEAGHVWSPEDPAALKYHGDGPERGRIQPVTGAATATAAGYRVLVQHHNDGLIDRTFPTWEEAKAFGDALSPDADGWVMPNLPGEVLAAAEADGWEYEAGLFWHSNRYGVIVSPAATYAARKTAAAPLKCAGCGETYFTDGERHGCEGAEGRLHDHWTEAKTADIAGIIGGEADEMAHVASEDYPELGAILVERPPLPHSTRVAARQAEARLVGDCDRCGQPHAADYHHEGSHGEGPVYAVTCPEDGLTQWHTTEGVYEAPDTPASYGLSTEAASIDPIPDWAILQQFTQYPATGPEGVSYFKGEIDAETWVDCLLYYVGGRLVGVLNHFPKDMGPERKGNVLLLVHPQHRQQGIGRALWEEAVRRWGVTKAQDTSPDGAAFLTRMSVLAGFWDRVLEPMADRVREQQQESGTAVYNPETGAMYSHDWCRFRHNRRCFYPESLNEEATKQAGYAVWNAHDRGYCPREKWDDQKACPAPSEPGPNSGERDWGYETWQSWEQGGQGRYAHLGMPAMPRAARQVDQSVEDMSKKAPIEDPAAAEFRSELAEMVTERKREKNPYVVSALTAGEFGFHLTATWRDVQAKAKQIREAGHVRVISASPEYLVGEVQGTANVYQTTLMREPGSKRVAMWECGCAWAAYSWGRSGRWKKYEGRLCSHALALNYEGQSRGWLGGEVAEDKHVPDWRGDQKVVVPGDYQRGPIGDWRVTPRPEPKAAARTAGLHYASVPGGFGSYEEAATWMMAEAQRYEPRVTPVLQREAGEHHGEMQGLEFRFKTFDSLLRKLTTKGLPPEQITEPFRVIYDALRYTIAFPEPDWGNSVQQTLWSIQDAGFAIVKEENTWAPGDSYSGLHYQLQPIGSDLIFELQFHTSASFVLKEKVLHKMYEEFRLPGTPLDRRQFLWDEMTRYWDNVPIPDDAMEFPDERVFLRPVALAEGTARVASTDPALAAKPVLAVVRDLLDDGNGPGEVIAILAAAGVADAPGLVAEAMSVRPFKGLVRGMVTEILNLFDDGTAETRAGLVPAREVLYPTFHPTRGLTASKTAAADRDGYMVAIEVPEQIATELHAVCTALYGEDAEDKANYHVTVAYPGPADEVDAEAFSAAVLEWATRWGPMTGAISGFGVFHQGGGEKVLYASVNIPGLDRARNDLVDLLSARGIALPDDYGFDPHLTLGYFGEANTPTPPQEMPEVTGAEFEIDAVTLALGGNWRQIPLAKTGPAALDKAAGIGGAPDATGDTFWDTPAGGTEGCDICGDSAHTTATHEAHPEVYDDSRRTAGKDENVPPSEHGDPRLQGAGVSVKRTKDGKYYVCTHRARGKYRDSVADIPDSEIEYIESTGARVETYDDIHRRASAEAAFKVCSMGHVGVALICSHRVLREGLTFEEAIEVAKGSVDGPEFVFERAAELREEPEAALPTTTAEEPEEEILAAEESVADIVAAFQRSAGASTLQTGAAPAASTGGDDMRIAEAARAHLAKDAGLQREALKAFSPAEQKQIIEEGAAEGVTAANLDRLDITGTHYEQLEAALAVAEAEASDEEWLM